MPVPLIAAGIGAAGSIAGAAISSGSNGGAPGIEDNYVQGPNYQSGQKATKQWGDWLTQAQNDPTGNYGAISPDWNDIWNQTQTQVRNYFEGTPTTPGVNDAIKASFAQRGMTGDPASSYLMSASGANEAQTMNQNAQAMNIAKQQFAQQGQLNWLNSLQNYQNQTANAPSGGTWTGSVPYATPSQQIGNAIGAAGSGIAGYGIQQLQNQQNLNWLQTYLNGMNNNAYNPTSTAFSNDLFQNAF